MFAYVRRLRGVLRMVGWGRGIIPHGRFGRVSAAQLYFAFTEFCKATKKETFLTSRCKKLTETSVMYGNTVQVGRTT